MALFGLNLKGKKRSFKEIGAQLPVVPDPLDFLTSGRNGASPREAGEQIHASIHSVLSETDRAVTYVFEQLRPDDELGSRTVVEANTDIKNELARATALAEAKRDQLREEVHGKLESLFIQRLIYTPDQDPFSRGWENPLRVISKDLPPPPEVTYSELEVDSGKRRRILERWQEEAIAWLEILCRNSVADVMRSLEGELVKYKNTWLDVTSELTRRARAGGDLYQQVSDPELWSFDSEDPTVKNLLSGGQAQEVASRIVNRFAPGNQDLADIGDMVRASLRGRPVYGTDSVGVGELEEHLAQAIAQKMRSALPVDTGFLSMVSNGTRFNEQLGELLAEMYRGAASMEQTLWRVGEGRVGHVDSTSGVGITASQVHDNVIRGLGGGRNFAAVEGHPSDTHRLTVQMSTVGAPASDLAIFREMIRAWYDWHFDQDRGHYDTEQEWLENVKSELWKLYPDMGVSKGVTKSIMELIDADLRAMYASQELLGTHSNGDLGDHELIDGLLRELGVTVSRNDAEL